MASCRDEDKGTPGDNAPSGDTSGDKCDSPPFPAKEYIERYDYRFNRQRFP